MDVNETICAWAQRRYGLEEMPVRVEFDHYEGFPGTDVTPADPPTTSVVAYFEDKPREVLAWDVELTTDLISEILSAAS